MVRTHGFRIVWGILNWGVWNAFAKDIIAFGVLLQKRRERTEPTTTVSTRIFQE